MIYLFKCKICGEYNVNKKTFKKFTTDEQFKELKKKIEKGAEGGVIKFNNNCPKCIGPGLFTLRGELIALWPKQSYY